MLFKEKTCCFTGHRNISESEAKYIRKWIRDNIPSIICAGYTFFGHGGALGFDTIISEELLLLKNDYPEIKIIEVIPFDNYRKYWDMTQKSHAKALDLRMDKIVVLSEKCNIEVYLARNRHLVDYSSLCVGYCKENNSGTGYTMSYSTFKGLKVVNIYDEMRQKHVFKKC